jgi:hypothetical protein
MHILWNNFNLLGNSSMFYVCFFDVKKIPENDPGMIKICRSLMDRVLENLILKFCVIVGIT